MERRRGKEVPAFFHFMDINAIAAPGVASNAREGEKRDFAPPFLKENKEEGCFS